MKKVVLFAFNGDPMCFVHVLLNALDLDSRGREVKIVIEGSATKLIPQLTESESPMHSLFEKAKNKGIIAGACRACSHKMGVLEAVRERGLELLDDMQGHPSMGGFMEKGFEVITF